MKKLLGCFLCVMLLVFGMSVSAAASTVPGDYDFLIYGPGNDQPTQVQAAWDSWSNPTTIPEIDTSSFYEIGGPAAWSGTWEVNNGNAYLYMSVKAASGPAGGGWALYYLGDYQTSGWFSTVATNDVGGVNYAGWYDLGGGHNMSHVRLWNANPVPEPATMLLLGSGLVALAGFGRKKKK